jgi:transcriptional regulator with XRE-family HTH domain
MKFNKILKQALKSKGLNQKQGAKICDVYPQQFNSYAKGINSPSFDKGVEMLKALDHNVIICQEENILK